MTGFEFVWLGYGLLLVSHDERRTIFMQGDEASELYDQLDEAEYDIEQAIISDYFACLEDNDGLGAADYKERYGKEVYYGGEDH